MLTRAQSNTRICSRSVLRSTRANPEQVANEQHLEQHHRINGRPAIVLAVQMLGRFVDEIKPDVPVEQAEQVVFRDQLLQRHYFQFRLGRVGRFEHADIIKRYLTAVYAGPWPDLGADHDYTLRPRAGPTAVCQSSLRQPARTGVGLAISRSLAEMMMTTLAAAQFWVRAAHFGLLPSLRGS